MLRARRQVRSATPKAANGTIDVARCGFKPGLSHTGISCVYNYAASHRTSRRHQTFEGKAQRDRTRQGDLASPSGEMVSLVGPSGSGKSTLLNLIGGLDRADLRRDPHRRRRTLAGLSDDELTRVRRDKIGFIFQFFNLLPTLSCVENVAIPLHLRGWPRKKIEERARGTADLVKLGSAAGSPARRTLRRRAAAGCDRARAVRVSADPAGR